MVAVEGPAPGPGSGRTAEESEVVGEFVHDAWGFEKFAEEVVDAHCADGFVVAFWGEGGFEDVHDRVADGWGHLVEADALVGEEELWVRPCAPLGRVDVIADRFLLFVVEEREEGLCCVDDLLDWDILVLECEQIGTDIAWMGIVRIVGLFSCC